MLKVDLHTHTADDPHDFIPHTAVQLIERAAEHGYRAIAVTLHDRQLDLDRLREYASDRGVVLLPGIERTIRGKHVLLINFPPAAEEVGSFEDLAALKRRCGGLVIAPHPFFPLRHCLGHVLDEHPELFDAVEINALYTRVVDFNERATGWAAARDKPLVGNGDVHRLAQLGTTWSDVEADAHPEAICAAIRAGRVQVRTRPLSHLEAANHFGRMLWSSLVKNGRVDVEASPQLR
jgi:predicted metal-dependent phosphoesterase TrpH